MHRLVLASQSPRRSELLAREGFRFTVTSTQISEIPDENLNLVDQIRDLAVQKAEACINLGKVLKGQKNLVLSADTVVVLDGKILGKPKDQEENKHFLRQMSGREHAVITAVCLVDVDTGRTAVSHEVSRIFFRALSDEEIYQYANSGEGLDKAGGYGIQGRAGEFVVKLEGEFENVMGLPVNLVKRMLKENGWKVDQRKPRESP